MESIQQAERMPGITKIHDCENLPRKMAYPPEFLCVQEKLLLYCHELLYYLSWKLT